MDDIETELNIAAAADSPEDEGRNHEPIKPAVLLHQSRPDPRGDVLMISHHIFKAFMRSRELTQAGVFIFRCAHIGRLPQVQQKVSQSDQRSDAEA